MWDVGWVTNMQHMHFNQPLEAWDIRRVTNLEHMFHTASAFNQPLEAWDVGRVSNMKRMFLSVHGFNHPLEAWDVGRVTNMLESIAGSTPGPILEHHVTDVDALLTGRPLRSGSSHSAWQACGVWGASRNATLVGEANLTHGSCWTSVLRAPPKQNPHRLGRS